MVRHSVTFIYNGQVLDTPLLLKSHKSCRISSIKPIAVPLLERVKFLVKGFNLSRSITRLLCAIEGSYLVQEICRDLMDGADPVNENDELQQLSFPCSIPNVPGRGFIEVEDHGFSSSFFPFIVAEQDVCSEICMLEGAIDGAEISDDFQKIAERREVKTQTLDFLHKMGWLLHRSHLMSRLGHLDPNSHRFPFKRFRWPMEFSMEHDWCAVVKKLMGILFDGTVDTGELTSIMLVLLDMSLLHGAVRRNCRPMVELLLHYAPDKELEPVYQQKRPADGTGGGFIFKPNVIGPAGLTPLHVAVCSDDAENVLDALTDDPGSVGIEAWKRTQDSTGLTQNDYASLRGHHSYIHLVQRKIKKQSSESGHLILDIPSSIVDYHSKQKQSDGSRVLSLQTEETTTKVMQHQCRLCEQKRAHGNMRSSLVYRPAMLSVVAIAAVCVCVALLYKSSPEVLYIFRPFRWEVLKYGSS